MYSTHLGKEIKCEACGTFYVVFCNEFNTFNYTGARMLDGIKSYFVCLFVCFVALRPKSTAMVIAGRSVHVSTFFSYAGLNKRLTSNLCTYFRL